MIRQPMLGARDAFDPRALRYPIAASPKLDGFRVLGGKGALFTRTMKLVENYNVQQLFQELPIFGWDGEMIVGSPTAKDVFNRTSSALRTFDGPSNVTWWLFDSFEHPEWPWIERWEALPHDPLLGGQIRLLPQRLIDTPDELLAYEAECVLAGYEGVMVRDPRAPYKQGRSTLREGWLLKMKRFVDDEALVVGFEELERNLNEARLDERGYTKRSTHQAGKVAGGTLGKLVCEWRGKTLRIGSGFSEALRDEIWNNTDKYRGQYVTFKYQEVGTMDLPRLPIFKAFRPKEEISE